MIITNLNNGLEEEVKNIHDNGFPFPDLSNPLYISKKVIISEGKVVGAGFVRLTAEGILILGKSVDLFKRSVGAQSVIDALRDDIKSRGLDECHVFVRETNICRFLQRQGFIYCVGTPMVTHF